MRNLGLEGIETATLRTLEHSYSRARVTALADALQALAQQCNALEEKARVRAVEMTEITDTTDFVQIHEALLDVVLDEGLLKSITSKLVELIKKLATCPESDKEDKGFLGKLWGLVRRRNEAIAESRFADIGRELAGKPGKATETGPDVPKPKGTLETILPSVYAAKTKYGDNIRLRFRGPHKKKAKAQLIPKIKALGYKRIEFLYDYDCTVFGFKWKDWLKFTKGHKTLEDPSAFAKL